MFYAKHIESGQAIEHQSNEKFFMASTYKLPLTIAILKQVEQGALSLNDFIQLKSSDLRPASYVLSRFEDDMEGVQLSLRNLIHFNLAYSDNGATDILFRLVGGPKIVQATLDELFIADINVSRTVLEIAMDLYGFDVNEEDIQALKQFDALIGAVPKDVSKQFREKFLNDQEKDTITPKAMAVLLEKIFAADIISESSRDLMLKSMRDCKTFKDRIPGLLPKGTVVARKTGTMDNYAADVGIISLPQNLGHVVLTVYIKQAKHTGAALNRVVAEISRTIHDYFLIAGDSS